MMHLVHRRLAALLPLILVGLPGPLHSQVTTRLSEPDARFPEPFSSVQGLRELSDGRLLVSDGLGQALVLVDLGKGAADTVGRVGPGPEEYRTPDGLFPWSDGKTLMVDLGNARLSVLDAGFRIVQTWPLAEGSGPGMLAIRVPVGTDREGHIYYQQMPPPRPGVSEDSAAVVRWNPATGAVDTVTRVKTEARRTSSSGGARNQMMRIMPLPLSPRDGWAVAWDGRVGVARSGDYHVEWVSEALPVARGPAIPIERVAVGRAEKEAWVSELGSSGIRVAVEVADGRQRTSFSRGGGGEQQRPDIDSFEWPEYGPPFVGSGVRVAADGSLWVRRYLKAGSPPTFDVFDGQGRLTRRVVLPPGRQLVGFGNGVVYATVKDEFDLQYLERYRL